MITYTEELNHRSITVSIAQDLDSLTICSADWNELVFDSPQQLPMLSYAWIYPYIKYRLNDNEKWFCLFAHENGTLVGVLPVICSESSFLGMKYQRLYAPFDDQTNTCDILLKENNLEILSILLKYVFIHIPNSFYLELRRITECSPTILFNRSLQNQCRMSAQATGLGAYLPVNADYKNYNDFLLSLSKNFRGNLSKARNKVKKLPDLSVEIKKSCDAKPELIDTFINVESKNWKGKAGSAIINSEKNKKFYTDLSKELYKAGWLQWHFLKTGDTTIAANLAVQMKDSIVLWKLGYDEAYSKCSPGSILLEKLLEDVYSSNSIKEINLTTDRPWYDNWGMQKRIYYDVYFYPKKFISILFFYLPRELMLYLDKMTLVKRLFKVILRRNKPAR